MNPFKRLIHPNSLKFQISRKIVIIFKNLDIIFQNIISLLYDVYVGKTIFIFFKKKVGTFKLIYVCIVSDIFHFVFKHI
jgi:hypothetical protein